jgi:hypothetical protein
MLWNSENDEREYDYEADNYEPMMPFLKNKLKEYGECLIRITQKRNESMKTKTMKNKLHKLNQTTRGFLLALRSKLIPHDPPEKYIRLTYTGKI